METATKAWFLQINGLLMIVGLDFDDKAEDIKGYLIAKEL